MGATFADIIAADVTNVFANPEQFAQLVTHVRSNSSWFKIVGVFTQGPMTPLTDGRQGRQNVDTGSLVLGPVDTDGRPIWIDDQGVFLICEKKWGITNVSPMDGGFFVTLKLTDIKTMRRLTSNG